MTIPFIPDMADEQPAPMRLDLPYPHKHLWPNGPRGHPKAVDREKRKHHDWATLETLGKPRPVLGDEPLPVKLTVHAKPKGPLPDRDNCVAALKVYLDAISKRIGINDRNFAAPTVEFADTRTSRFVIEVGHG